MKKFIKLLDKQVAEAISLCGFCYMEEKINKDQTIYVFEQTPEIEELVNRYLSDEEFSNMVVVCESGVDF